MVFFSSAILFALFAGAFDEKKRRKRKSAAKKSSEPLAKRLKRSIEESSSSSSSEDDDYSLDSDSSFDIFSSESDTDSNESTYEEYTDKDDASGSDRSPSQNDISIKEEPFWDSETEHLNGDAKPEEQRQQKRRNSRRNQTQRISNDSLPVTEIKTEVLDSIVEGVEVDRNSLLNNAGAVQIKDEPLDEVESAEIPVEIKEEIDTNDVTSSSQQDVTQN